MIFHHRQPVNEGGGAKEKERVGGREGGREERRGAKSTASFNTPTECRVGSALAIRADQNRKSTNIFTTFNGYQPMSNQKSNLKLVFLEFLL